MAKSLLFRFLFLLLLFSGFKSYAQTVPEKDLVDVADHILKSTNIRNDTTRRHCGKVHYSGLPGVGYTLLTHFSIILFGNAVFTTCKDPNTKTSSALASITLSERKQLLIPLQTNIWTIGNKYNIVTDWRFLIFPSFTYGLGMYTKLSDGYIVDYNLVRFHQKILREVTKNIYIGPGYAYDYFWNIEEVNPPTKPTDYELYGLTSKAQASGFTLNAQYDNRLSSVNPTNGFYTSVVYRDNLKVLASDANWESLQIDTRAYLKLPGNSGNVLAFWSYDWFTLAGTPPYLLLPYTGGDTYNNTGRGYIQGRYRGKNMLYLESEYRFNITRNGLFGAVIFVNAESVTEPNTNRFEVVAPGYGGGIRIKLNKYSRTNIAVDYGIGIGGSRGFFVNLGEVF